MVSRASALQRLGPSRYLEIRYEDFVGHPVAQGKLLADFVGKELTAATRRRLKKAFTSSVRIGSRQMEPCRLQEANDIAGELLVRLGYA
jgi:hypothetical protein